MNHSIENSSYKKFLENLAKITKLLAKKHKKGIRYNTESLITR